MLEKSTSIQDVLKLEYSCPKKGKLKKKEKKTSDNLKGQWVGFVYTLDFERMQIGYALNWILKLHLLKVTC